LAVTLGLGIVIFLVALLYQREKLKQGVIFIAACLLVMQPWGLRNYFVFNNYTLSSTEGGHVFWLGNNPEYDLGEHPDFTRYGGYTVMFKPPPGLARQIDGKTEPESNRIFAREAWQHISHHPKAFFVRAFHKTWNMWRPTFGVSSFQNKLISYTFYPLLLFLSLCGIFLAWRLKFRSFTLKNFLSNLIQPFGLLSVFLIIHLLLHAAINGEIRFRVPLWIVLVPFASVSFVSIFDYLKSFRTMKIKDITI
jgi:hypothetical protein